MIVENNKVVSLSYELKVNGETVETVGADSPLMFLFGAGNLLPKFEKNLDGLKLNDSFDFELVSADAVIFGTPTRFGNMCGQMRQFLDSTGHLWAAGALVGKVGSVFTSSNTQHGGQESTILSFHLTLLHHGMIIVGLPYTFQGQMRIDEITGGSPYGASTIAGPKGQRMPSENELSAARFQGKHVAVIAARLAR